ncbi:hypothetical protein COB64_00505 [Candidatus Wolfebacteria bacterium]|nr:MAG: hypothetical protein COB64_00505 [Candidatus Wolfebacteria bacterium]
MNNTEWLFTLKKDIPRFLETMKGTSVSGFFRYSLTGDLYGEEKYWGLGNTVFAVKNYYMLGILDTLSEEEKKNMADFIKSFQIDDGSIYDPLIKKKAWLREKAGVVKHRDFNNFFHTQTIRAETRQALSALNILEVTPTISYKNIPHTEEEIDEYLKILDWTKPWGAGSHFSHLLFFLKHSDLKNKEALIDFAVAWVHKIQNREDGSWYKGAPTHVQKVNAAMKILTGLKAAERMYFHYPDKLIDLCLEADNNRQACDNFNIIYVLNYANKMLRGSYRNREIQEAARRRLDIYRQYYFPKRGGFSFSHHKANRFYYEARITRGFDEPDIHGTCLFLWGISIIAQMLDVDKELGFKEHTP